MFFFFLEDSMTLLLVFSIIISICQDLVKLFLIIILVLIRKELWRLYSSMLHLVEDLDFGWLHVI